MPNGSHSRAIGAVLWVAGIVFAALIIVFLRAHFNAEASPELHAAEPPQEAEGAVMAAKLEIVHDDPEQPVGVFGVNFALAANGATATGGKRPELLIDGNSTRYDGARGFAYTVWRKTPPLDSFVVQFKEVSEIDCVRLLLWDMEENRFYRYKLEVSGNGNDWAVVSDRTGTLEECQSWQVIRFAKRPVKAVRLTGTFNSANSEFHVVELQALMAPPNGFLPDPKTLPAPATPQNHEQLEF